MSQRFVLTRSVLITTCFGCILFGLFSAYAIWSIFHAPFERMRFAYGVMSPIFVGLTLYCVLTCINIPTLYLEITPEEIAIQSRFRSTRLRWRDLKTVRTFRLQGKTQIVFTTSKSSMRFFLESFTQNPLSAIQERLNAVGLTISK